MNPHPVEVEQIHHELVRMLGLDAELGEFGFRKVPQIRGDNDLGSRSDRCGKHMPIIDIRQRQGGDEFFVTSDQTVRNRDIHQLTQLVQFRDRDVRTVLREPYLHIS